MDGCGFGLPLDSLRTTRSTPASTLNAMASAVDELAELVDHGPDRLWTLSVANELRTLAAHLATAEVRHG